MSEQEMRISSSGGMLTVNTGSELIVFIPKVQTAAPVALSQPPQMFAQTEKREERSWE